jgi:hypothetical protein
MSSKYSLKLRNMICFYVLLKEILQWNIEEVVVELMVVKTVGTNRHSVARLRVINVDIWLFDFCTAIASEIILIFIVVCSIRIIINVIIRYIINVILPLQILQRVVVPQCHTCLPALLNLFTHFIGFYR